MVKPGKSIAKTSPRSIVSNETAGAAVELRKQGLTYAEIADQLGLSNKGAAYKAVARAMRDTTSPHVEEYRALMDDELLEAAEFARRSWLDGGEDCWFAMDRWIKLQAQRIDLWGLKANEAKIADAAGAVAAASMLQVSQTFAVIQQALADPRLALTPEQLAVVPVVLTEYLERADITTTDEDDDGIVDAVVVDETPGDQP